MPRDKPKANTRPDHNGTQRAQFESNKRKIYATQTVCGICGKPVDFRLKFPHPLSACIDHIIPVSKGGHPSDLANLQLAGRSRFHDASNDSPAVPGCHAINLLIILMIDAISPARRFERDVSTRTIHFYKNTAYLSI